MLRARPAEACSEGDAQTSSLDHLAAATAILEVRAVSSAPPATSPRESVVYELRVERVIMGSPSLLGTSLRYEAVVECDDWTPPSGPFLVAQQQRSYIVPVTMYSYAAASPALVEAFAFQGAKRAEGIVRAAETNAHLFLNHSPRAAAWFSRTQARRLLAALTAHHADGEARKQGRWYLHALRNR